LNVLIVKPLKPKPMAQCSNCKKNLSCGCQKRTATDGKSVCTNCITNYQAQQSMKNPITKVAGQTPTTQPTGVNKIQ